MKTRLRQILAIVALAALAASATGGEWHVANQQEFNTALNADAATAAGDHVIWLTNGYYTGYFSYTTPNGGSLTIQAEPGVTNTAITLDAGGASNDLNLFSSANRSFTVRGLTFKRTGTQSALRISTVAGALVVDNCRFLGGYDGLEIVSGSSVVVSNCLVNGGSTGISINNVLGTSSVQGCTVSSNSGYGGVVVWTGQLVVGGSSFRGNTGSSGNSAGTGGAITCYSPAILTLTNSTLTGNHGTSGALFSGSAAIIAGNTFTGNSPGGGISGGYAAYVSGNVFMSNSCSGDGGGAHFGSFSTITLNTFVGNSATARGGGLATDPGPTLSTLSSNVFLGNSAGYLGGGARVNFGAAGTLSVVGNSFSGNSSTYGGAGYGGGLVCEGGTSSTSTIVLSNNTFLGNSTLSTSYGGGASCSASNLTLWGNTFRQNSAGNAAGCGLTATVMFLFDNLLTKNFTTAAASTGGGIGVYVISNLFMINNTVFNNTAVGSGGGLNVSGAGLLNVYNNIIWGNSAGTNGADVSLTSASGLQRLSKYNDIHDTLGLWTTEENRQDVDPQFFDPVNGDYHLRPTSSLVNVGTNGAPYLPATDLDGNSRINAGTVDLGCYEFNNGFLHPADTNNDWVISPAEYNAYGVAWQNGQSWPTNPVVIPADFATRAGYLRQNGGAYTNDGSAQPTGWKLRP